MERRYTALCCFVLGEAEPYAGRELCLGMLSVLVDLRSPVLPERKPPLPLDCGWGGERQAT